MDLNDIQKLRDSLASKNIKIEKATRSIEELIKDALEQDAKKKHVSKEEKKQSLAELELQTMLAYDKEHETKEEKHEIKYTLLEHKDNQEWDVKKGDKIEYFDSNLSYELTGYRPITETLGLDFDPKLFTVAANNYRQYGRYTHLVPGTFKHKLYWDQEWDRCVHGLTIGKYRITGENYFWLNYYRLQSVISEGESDELRNEDFPGFMNKQYEYFHYLEMVRILKKDGLAFKSRAVNQPAA